MATKDDGGVDFKGSGAYRIRVQGRLDAGWSDRLGGLSVVTTGRDGSCDETVLEGRLPDQAALAGVLNTVYELQLSVLNVERLPDEDGA